MTFVDIAGCGKTLNWDSCFVWDLSRSCLKIQSIEAEGTPRPGGFTANTSPPLSGKIDQLPVIWSMVYHLADHALELNRLANIGQSLTGSSAPSQ